MLHFFAVYDGHGGIEAAQHCATRLHYHLSVILSTFGTAAVQNTVCSTPSPSCVKCKCGEWALCEEHDAARHACPLVEAALANLKLVPSAAHTQPVVAVAASAATVPASVLHTAVEVSTSFNDSVSSENLRLVDHLEQVRDFGDAYGVLQQPCTVTKQDRQ